jgi:hypothetical protein
MTIRRIAGLAAAAGLTLGAGAAFAWDNEAGVPLSPQEAGGQWTLESRGHAICRVDLYPAHRARAADTCGGALPGYVTGWRPTSDGMALTDSSGRDVVVFGRWSNSLFVSKQGSSVDVQLQRGGPLG